MLLMWVNQYMHEGFYVGGGGGGGEADAYISDDPH